MEEGKNSAVKEMTVYEEIIWLLDQITDERLLRIVETIVNRIVLTGRP